MSSSTNTEQNETQSDLGYRGWERQLTPTWLAWWPIARTSMFLLFRRKLLWLLLAAGTLNFLFMFAVIYIYTAVLMRIQTPGFDRISDRISEGILSGVSGDGDTFSNFIFRQGVICVLMLSFGGAVLVGSDHRQGGLIFYLSRRIGRFHYLFGKFLGIAALVSMVTTIPAIVLYIQYGMMTLDETYFQDTYTTIFFGILIYGTLVSVTLSLLCLGLGSWMHRTVPLVMSWGMLFILMPMVSAALHRIFTPDFRHEKSAWLLLNLWRDLRIIGEYFFNDLKDADAPYLLPMVLIVFSVSKFSALAAWWKLRVIRVVS